MARGKVGWEGETQPKNKQLALYTFNSQRLPKLDNLSRACHTQFVKPKKHTENHVTRDLSNQGHWIFLDTRGVQTKTENKVCAYPHLTAYHRQQSPLLTLLVLCRQTSPRMSFHCCSAPDAVTWHLSRAGARSISRHSKCFCTSTPLQIYVHMPLRFLPYI